jgi:hypothetical protein
VIQLLFFLTVGAILFAFLVVLARRGRAEGGAEVLVAARQALFTLQTELLSDGLVARIFDGDDLDFVLSESTPQVKALFLEERNRIALMWVGRVRNQIQLLRQLHLGSARFYARLDFKAEIALAVDFMLLLVSCRALQVAFLIGGPYAAPRVVGTVAEAATRVCEVSGRSLAFLTDVDLDNLGSASTGGRATV